MAIDTKKQFKPTRNRSYLNRDFDSFKAQLLDYAKIFFPNRIGDFSEASVGGMFLDFASFTGDTLSFYLDHQFAELNPITAVETQNIERMLRSAGIKITGTSPAVATVNFTIEVAADKSGANYVPRLSLLPQILKNTVVSSQSGVDFDLTEDLDFSKKDADGKFIATITLASTTTSGTPSSFFMMLPGICISGKRKTEKFTFSNAFVPFREITLASANVTEVISVKDSDMNVYYEVGSLTQDNVFTALVNFNIDNDMVKENLELKPAPYRFVTQTNFNSKKTKLTFGSGDATSLDDDIVPDPSEFAVPLYGKRNFSRFSIDPNSLLQTKTLGISPQNTTISVDYRYGGGLKHNESANKLRTISTLRIRFLNSPSVNGARTVRSSLTVINPQPAGGGENSPTLEELKLMIPAARNSQSRIVTKEDLLARVYTMPSNFGRVYRASVRSNPNNPLATQLFIVSRDRKGALVISPDSLNKNLVEYLNEFRMISDAVDILDAAIINLQVKFAITADPSSNKSSVVQQIIAQLKKFFQQKNFQIDQVISINDVEHIIFNTPGVMSVTNLKFYGLSGMYNGKAYNNVTFNPSENTIKGLIVPPVGGMFEIKYPNADIIGSSV